MNRTFIKLPKAPHDWLGRDWSHHKTFGVSTAQPQNWLTRILDQGMLSACTAFTATAMREAQKKFQYDPNAQWQQELAFVGNQNADGVSLDVQMAVGIEKGFIPDGVPGAPPQDPWEGYMNVTPTQSFFNPSGLDTFDSIKEALSVAPLSAGVTWYEDWNTTTGIVPHTTNNKLGDHDTKLAYVETINGVEYIVDQGSWGPDQGDGGKFYFDRYMANAVFTLGIKYGVDQVPQNVAKLGLLWALYLNVKSLLTQLVDNLGFSKT